VEHVDREHRIGHSYLMDSDGNPFKTFEDLVFALKYRILPLLQDYALDDFEMLNEILGSGFIDVDGQRVKAEAFLTEAALQAALTSLMTP
jgi:5-methylcytosine-specific restriction protein B